MTVISVNWDWVATANWIAMEFDTICYQFCCWHHSLSSILAHIFLSPNLPLNKFTSLQVSDPQLCSQKLFPQMAYPQSQDRTLPSQILCIVCSLKCTTTFSIVTSRFCLISALMISPVIENCLSVNLWKFRKIPGPPVCPVVNPKFFVFGLLGRLVH